MRTQELLQLHDGATRSQPVMDRVAVGVMLAMLIVKVVLVDGRRGSLVNLTVSHAGWLCAVKIGNSRRGEKICRRVKVWEDELYRGGIGSTKDDFLLEGVTATTRKFNPKTGGPQNLHKPRPDGDAHRVEQ